MSNALAISLVVIKELIRRKDFYVLFVLTALITLGVGSLNFFDDDKIVRFIKEICLTLIWICSLVIAIAPAARQIPAERENRTIFPLLAKPVSRWELILGKFLGCWLACGFSLFVFYLFFGLVAASREHHWPLLHYAQAVLLHWTAAAVIISLALLGSIVFAAPSSNGTICFVVVLGILWFGGHLNKVALMTGGVTGSILYVIYFLIPHLEWAYNVRELAIHNGDFPSMIQCLLAAGYYLVYSFVFLTLAWLLFRGRSLN